MALIQVGMASDRGQVAQDNQDSVFALSTLLPAQAVGGNPIPFGLFAVADGMGGLSDGAAASSTALRIVSHRVTDRLLSPALGGEGWELTVAELLRTAVEEASGAIFSMASAARQKSGSTLSVALVMGRQVTLAHVGDSRVYQAGPDGIELLTNDHSIAARLVEIGHIAPEENVSRNRIYRSLGLAARIDPDIMTRRVGGDNYLVLCSDGVWGLIGDDEIATVLRENPQPQTAADRLVEIANARGGPDNASVVVALLPLNG